jgi:hypothetical protein
MIIYIYFFRGLLRNTSEGWIIDFVGSYDFTSNINAEHQVISHGRYCLKL